MKIHTSNRKKVEEILNNTIISGPFWDYTLKYKLDETYNNYNDLVDDDYFNMPEFKWSNGSNKFFIYSRCNLIIFDESHAKIRKLIIDNPANNCKKLSEM